MPQKQEGGKQPTEICTLKEKKKKEDLQYQKKFVLLHREKY